jgi:hypothetical protein
VFPKHHATSAKDMPPFNKSQIFTLSFTLSTFVPFLAWENHHSFYLAFGAPSAFLGGRFLQDEGQGTLSESHSI